MLFSVQLVTAVAHTLNGRGLPVVVDPVMIASSGSTLLRTHAIATMTAPVKFEHDIIRRISSV